MLFSSWQFATMPTIACRSQHVPFMLSALIAATILSQPVHSIVQGEIDSTNQYSQVCALLQQSTTGYSITCSAVLIGPAILLTAAHCAGQYQYASCDTSVEGKPNIYKANPAKQHPSRNDSTLSVGQQQDLAVVKLEGGPSGASIAQLPVQYGLNDLQEQGSLDIDQAFVVVGYGGTKRITDPYADPGDVGAGNRDRLYTPANYVRVTINGLIMDVSLGKGTGGSVCRGDSGGGVFHSATGELVGITIEADGTCSREAIANRIDTPVVRQWLVEQGIILA